MYLDIPLIGPNLIYAIVKMEADTFKLMPYQYPLDILGSRRFRYTNISSNYMTSKTLVFNITNDIEKDNLTIINSEWDILSRWERQADLDVAASGYGSYCPEGIPIETALFAILGAFAVAFGILFMTITMITGGRKRKKREASLHDYNQNDTTLKHSEMISDLIWQGTVLCETSGTHIIINTEIETHVVKN